MVNAVVVILAVALAAAVVRFVRYRQSFAQFQGSLPRVPHDLLLGTLKAMGDVYGELPPDIHPAVPMTMLARKYQLGPMFMLDNWPAIERMVVIQDADIANQLINSHHKHPILAEVIGHICGPSSMLYSAPHKWKRSRALFNPGFAPAHLMSQVSVIVDKTKVFARILGERADRGEVFCLEPLASRLAVDIMGSMILDHELNSQTEDNELVHAFRQAAYWTPQSSPINPLPAWNPVGVFRRRHYSRVMNTYLSRVLEERFQSGAAKTTTQKGGKKPAIDLALNAYYTEVLGDAAPTAHRLDAAFKWDAIDQMKTFLFAGHDTTSSALCICYYLLAIHTACRDQVRAELDAVLGDPATAADRIQRDPYLINQLVYLNAVIKESLRLFPPASSVRLGTDDFKVVHAGETFDLTGCVVWINVHALHHRADLWPSPDQFIPERFLPAPHNWQDVPKDAWRPFERGPRACIGQELAMLELRIFLALTIREFDVAGAYDVWDAKMGRERPGEMLDGKRGTFGYRAYQVLHASAKPSDDMPVRVQRVI